MPFQKNVFCWPLLGKNIVWVAFRKNVFSVGQKSMEKVIPEHRPATNPASQKTKQSPTENRFKFQNNNPKNGVARRTHRPIFGASAACGASVVVLKFVSIFCWTLHGFLAGWILCWPMLWDGFFHGFLADRKKLFQKAAQKTVFQKTVSNKNAFSMIS